MLTSLLCAARVSMTEPFGLVWVTRRRHLRIRARAQNWIETARCSSSDPCNRFHCAPAHFTVNFMQRDERCKYGCGFMREPKFMAAVSGRRASLHISGAIHHAINPLTSSLPSSHSAATRCSAMLLRFHTRWHLNEQIHECTSLTLKRPAEECAFRPAVNSPRPTPCCQGWP